MKVLFFSTEIWSNSPEGIVVRKYIKGLLENNYTVDIVSNKKIDINFFKGKYFVFNNYFNEFIDKILKNILGLEKLGFILNFIKNYKDKMRLEDYDVIIVRSEPVSIHLISLYLKKKFPNKKIVCSFSDIGYLNPYYSKKFFIKKQVSRYIEKNTFKHADLITHTNKFVFKRYLDNDLIVNTKKNFILENPLEIDNILKEKKERSKEILNLGYIGSFYGRRSPEPVFSYISKIDKNKKIKFYIFGGVRNIYYDKRLGKIGNYFMKKELNIIKDLAKKYQIDSQITITPFLNPKELNEFIDNNIDVLVNVDAPINGENVFLSSKIVDYLKYNLPILNFSNKGASSEFLKQIGVDCFIDYDSDNYLNILKDDLALLIPDKEKIHNFTSKELMKKMIDKLVNNEGIEE